MKIVIACGFILGGALASALATAGAKGGSEVTFSGSTVYASIAAARASDDVWQRVGCYTYLYSGGAIAVCEATNKNDTTHLCIMSDPGSLAVVANLNDSSYINFTFDGGGGCSAIFVDTDSYFGGH